MGHPATAQGGAEQHRPSWPQMLAEISPRRPAGSASLRLVAPLAREFLKRQSAYYRQPGALSRQALGRGASQVGCLAEGSEIGVTNQRVAVVIGKAPPESAGPPRVPWLQDGCRVTIADRDTEGAQRNAAELGEPHSWAAVKVLGCEDSVARTVRHHGVVVSREGSLHAWW